MKRVFRGLALLIVFVVIVGYLVVLLPPAVSAASRTWTTDTDFNAAGATFTGTEVVGTGVPARVELLKTTTDWKNENPSTNPGVLESPSATFDSKDNVTVLFGGYSTSTFYSDKTWEYNHATNTWTEITTTPKPPARQSAGLSYDPVQNVVVLFGGYNDTMFLTDTWELNVVTNTWAQIAPPVSPPSLVDTPLAYHASAQRHIVFGQNLATGTMETWAYDAGADTWTNRNPTGSPSARSGFAIAYSPQRDRTVLFGGSLLTTLYDQTFEYNYASSAWAQISVTGPAARVGHSMTYRPASTSILLFGGATSTGNSQETWRYFTGPGGPTWAVVGTPTRPPSRQNAAMTFDTKDDVAVLYGGIDSAGLRLGDTWTLGAAYGTAGKYASAVGDSGGFPIWGTLWWNKTPANQPANTFLRFQIATSTSAAGPWSFVGFDGTVTTYYTTVGTTLWNGHNGQRYLRFLADFGSTNTQATPSMEDVSINYDIPPAPPCIVTTDPADLTFGVPTWFNITITFSEAMNRSSLGVTFVLGPPLTFTASWSAGDSIVTLTHPGVRLAENKVYRLQINANDLDGLPLSATCPGGGAGAPNPFTFVTERINPWITNTNPAYNQGGVPWLQSIFVNFSEGMNPSSLVVSLTPNNVALSPSWSNGDATLTLSHTQGFSQCTPYSVQINATDKANLALVPGPVPNPWTFLSFCDNPYIVSTSPRNVQPGVALGASVVLTFSEAMMRSSLSFTISPTVTGQTLTWSSGDTVLTMTHTGVFTGCGVYTVTVNATDLTGKPLIPNPIDSTVVDPFKFVAVCANPYIIQTVPADGATNVAQTQEVRIAFSEAMVPSTVKVTISPSAREMSRTWDANALVHIQYDVLNQCRRYTVHVTDGQNTNGNGLVAGPVPNPWSFDIICNAPYLTATDPANASAAVPVGKTVVVNFNKAMNTGTVVVNLAPPDVTFTRAWSNGNTTLTLTHANFVACRQYTISVDGISEDGYSMILGPGAPGVPNPWIFTTRCAGFYITNTDPVNLQQGVSLAQSIVIDFSEAADPARFGGTLSPTTALSPAWSNGNTRVTLSHTPPFPDCVTHSMTITAFNTTGGTLINVTGSKPNPWTFKTVCVPPFIVSTNPADGATNVGLLADIVVTFSEAMRPPPTLAWTILPTVPTLTGSLSNGNTVLTLTHTTPFATCTLYTVQVQGTDVDGNQLVAGPVPNPWTFTTTCGVAAPGGLRVIRAPGGADIVLQWRNVTGASSYVIYSSPNRFSWPWTQIGEVFAPTTSFTAGGHGGDGATHYYLVRTKDAGGSFSGNSTMGVKAHLAFAVSASRSNVYWMSIPYRSMYKRASDISNELTATRIDVLGKWNPQTQTTILWYYLRGSWRGTNFALAPGDGFYVGVRSTFAWVVNGTDGVVAHSFTFYPSPNSNVNWISLPYTNGFSRASDIVRNIENGTGPSANTKIIEIARWDPNTQALVRFSWTPTGWSGTDFLLGVGEGLYVKVVSSFTWTPRLLTPEVP